MRGRRAGLWSMPLVLALATACGLTSALLGDGAWDALSWVGLATPLVVCVRYAAGGRGVRG